MQEVKKDSLSLCVSLAISYIATRITEVIGLCDGGNMNSYLWLN